MNVLILGLGLIAGGLLLAFIAGSDHRDRAARQDRYTAATIDDILDGSRSRHPGGRDL